MSFLIYYLYIYSKPWNWNNYKQIDKIRKFRVS